MRTALSPDAARRPCPNKLKCLASWLSRSVIQPLVVRRPSSSFLLSPLSSLLTPPFSHREGHLKRCLSIEVSIRSPRKLYCGIRIEHITACLLACLLACTQHHSSFQTFSLPSQPRLYALCMQTPAHLF